ncbi:subtilase [Striga asiatica]|uniref:Subtilase n=1 Tax=Striga asiatica TaxID=4170 RepID=A0A5A7PBZ7_STRAF|nr:subtilase [Striga asiatica]
MEPPNSWTLFLLSCLLLLAHHAHHTSAKRSTYIVHMDKSSMPKPFSSHHHWYSSILKSDHNPGPGPKLLYTYDHAFHGFSVVLSETELQSVKNSPGFLTAYRDEPVTPETTHTYKFLSLNTASGLWPASNYGENVIIGIIDTGIWPESPSFRDEGLPDVPARWKGTCQAGQAFPASTCNRKIIGARYFNAGFRAEAPDFPITMNSARDIDGHGTHVAATAAGARVPNVSFFGYAPGTASGVAPRARIAVYKVLWGGGVSSDILAGIDQAVADGVDIISGSLSSRTEPLYENPLSIASFGAREKGILVALAAGNRGPSLRTTRSAIPWAVIVASGTVDRWFAGTVTLGNGRKITGWTTFPARASVRALPLDFNIMERARFPFPGAVITPVEARAVVEYTSRDASPTATIDFQETVVGAAGPRPGPMLSQHSSRGPGRNYELVLKPDILAPGVLILAAYNPYSADEARIGRNVVLSTEYTLLSGTSMACPHVSGVAALLKGAHPEWSPAAIQSAMMTTANPLDNAGRPIREYDFAVATPLGIGSGHVDPNRALDPGLVYDASVEDLASLVCSMNFTREQTRSIIRSSGGRDDCSSASADLNYPSFAAVFYSADEGRSLTRRFRRTVTNVGPDRASYRVRVEAPANTTVTIRPRTLVFRKKYEKLSYEVRVRFRADLEIQHRPGAITWVELNGTRTVRSPIMVSAGADFFE